MGDLNVRALLGQESVALLGRDLSVVHVNGEAPASWAAAVRRRGRRDDLVPRRERGPPAAPCPGRINALNAAMAASLALSLGRTPMPAPARSTDSEASGAASKRSASATASFRVRLRPPSHRRARDPEGGA